MNKPTVSVVIPAYNYGQFVIEAVDSVLTQTFTDFELIVVDDGSTDDTRDRLAPYLDRIRYIRQENRGLSAARNAGIRAAHGRLIAFLDADDTWMPNKLAVQVPVILAHEDVGLIACTSRRFDEPVPGEVPSPATTEISVDELVIRTRFGPGSVICRTECFDACGLFDEELRSAEDRDMWIRIARKYRVLCLEAPLWRYRVHHTSMSYNVPRMWTAQKMVLRKVFRDYPEFRRRLLLRMKAYSMLHYDSAYVLTETNGPRLRALGHFIMSFLWFPGPFGVKLYGVRFIRTRTLLRCLLSARGFAALNRLKGAR